ncbi:MAG: hypothetical protein J6334_04715 [Kiritimatiellae bacterium]|nr:hypothetical protein [Kiritimatiellia bacterium]
MFSICLPLLAGNRPYEFVEAGRTEDAHPAMLDFETECEWTIRCWDAEATFERSQDEQLFGDWTGKLTYRATGINPRISIRLTTGLPLPKDTFDTMSLWIRGETFTMGANKIIGEPTPSLTAVFRQPDGHALSYPLASINWKGWFLRYVRFPQADIPKLRESIFVGFELTGCSQKQERVIYLDSLAIFKDELKPLSLKPRAKRNLEPLPGADQGLNTGAGTLPFPTREETILPDIAEPLPGEPLAQFTGGARAGTATNLLQITSRRIGRTLVIDFYAPPGAVTELSAGLAVEGRHVRRIDVPYLNFDTNGNRVQVDLLEHGALTLFRLGLFDWYRSNASRFSIRNTPQGTELSVVYDKKSDGSYNPLSERLFITLSPDFAGVLPNIPNPKSPWKKLTGSVTWRSHAAYNHDLDKKLWKAVHRHGIRDVLITDHETMWREGGESYTLRTRTDPSKGGDEAHRAYTRFLIDELGYHYGPYNNFTDFAPVNAYWTPDWVTRQADLKLIPSWIRAYAFRPAAAPEACERIAPLIQEKFNFNTAYCDVHTAVTPWGSRVDYDARVPGAATFAETFYAWGETLLLQKKIWGGPVWSEGGHHFLFAGLADGNYAADRGRPYADNPWLVDFDLLKIHPLETDFGMGCLAMFKPGDLYIPKIASPHAYTNLLDRFFGATLAFGHSGYLVLDHLFSPQKAFGLAYCGPGEMTLSEEGFALAMRSHFMIQQIAARYTQSEAVSIHYADASGTWLPTSEALKADIVPRNQIRVVYRDGTRVCVNGNETERLKSEDLDLPPCGYYARSGDGEVVVSSDDAGGVRTDYCASPAYIYIDGRGRETVREKARAAGPALCRVKEEGWEIIPLGNRPCAFRIPGGEALAVTFEGEVIGPAEVTRSDGWYAVKPVEGAFSYAISPAKRRRDDRE